MNEHGVDSACHTIFVARLNSYDSIEVTPHLVRDAQRGVGLARAFEQLLLRNRQPQPPRADGEILEMDVGDRLG
jgi:hypothetical protein